MAAGITGGTSYSSGVVNKPEVLSALMKLLGTTDCSVGTLAKNGGINIWSRYKPFRSSVLTFEQDKAGSSSQDRYNAMRAANWGLVPWRMKDGSRWASVYTIMNDASIIQANIDGELNGWEYQMPRGKNNLYDEPYRLSDFLWYSHKAKFDINNIRLKHDINKMPLGEYTIELIGDTSMTAVGGEGDKEQLNLGIGDFPVLSGCKLGVFVEKPNGDVKVVTTDNMLDIIDGWNIGMGGGDVGDVWWVTPFLFTPNGDVTSAGANTDKTTLSMNYAYTIPYAKRLKAVVCASKVDATFVFTKVSSFVDGTGDVTVSSINIINSYSEAKTFTAAMYVEGYESSTRYALSDVTVAGNGSTRVTIGYKYSRIDKKKRIVLELKAGGSTWLLYGSPHYPNTDTVPTTDTV